MARFDELVDFKNENGDCNVPQSQGPLGMWVGTQRQLYKNGNLSQERVDFLEASAGNLCIDERRGWTASMSLLTSRMITVTTSQTGLRKRTLLTRSLAHRS